MPHTDLAQAGLAAQTPLIRSSDENLIATCPFKYFLTRRLGIVSAFPSSKAATRGIWFHRVFEHYDLPPAERRTRILALAEKEATDLRATIARFPDIGPEREMAMVESLRTAAREALAHFECAAAVRPQRSRDLGAGFLNYLGASRWKNLAQECLLVHTDRQNAPRVPRVAQPDLLLYDRINNNIWIVDLKTTGLDLADYSNSLRFEFQTQHYIRVASDLAQDGTLRAAFDIPRDAKVAGMKHLLISMPTISLGDKDRPYHYHSMGKKQRREGTARRTSPKEWQVQVVNVDGELTHDRAYADEHDAVVALHNECGKQPSKVIHYESPPSIDAYADRLMDWFLGRRDYAHLSDERAQHPCVNLATTYTSDILDERTTSDYNTALRTIHDHATRKPDPTNFPRRARGSVDSLTRKATPYSGFYRVDDVTDWPGLMAREHLIQEHRDTSVSIHTPDTVTTKD